MPSYIRLEIVLEKLVPQKGVWPLLLNDGSLSSSLPLEEGLEYDHLTTEELANVRENLMDIKRKRVRFNLFN